MTIPAAAGGGVGGFTPTGGFAPTPWSSPPLTAPKRRRRAPWWLALLALVPLLAGLAVWWSNPGSLHETQLVGVREPGCVRLVIASDVSGSMDALTQPRDAAVDQLLAWAPQNLRADDELALISFSSSAAIEIPPTPIGQPVTRGAPTVSGGTSLAPLLETIAGLPATRCRTALLLLGDGEFSDLPADEALANRQLANARVDTFDFLVPGRIDVPPQWGSLYPSASPEFFDGTNPDQTALVFGRHLAALTNQQLQRTTA